MNLVRHLDERLLTDVNGLARRTPWLHGMVLGHATYGVARMFRAPAASPARQPEPAAESGALAA
jgi:hypothetical protein